MKKLFKNEKGFTLIELMMVIAVIGILAAVLVPKMGGVKTNANLAGVDANVRQVEATVHGLIERYKNNGDEFDEALINALNGEDGNADEDDITNPFNDKFGAGSSSAGNYAVIVVEKTETSNGNNVPGFIHVNVNYNSDKILNEVVITPFDNKGEKMPSKTIEP